MGRRHLDELTDREREVLALLRRDFTNEQIAQRLGISLDGAKYHVSEILSKLGVATREEAAAVALGERRRWWVAWPLWGKIAGAATVASGVAGIVIAFSSGGGTVTLESGVLADDRFTRGAPPPAGRTPSPANAEKALTPTPTGLASPAPTPSVVLIGPTVVNIFDLPTPEPQPTPTPTPMETPGPTGTPPATPTPCDVACSGIQGTVVITACPVDDGREECYPPYQATVEVWNADRTEVVLEFTTDEQGRFQVPLSEGEYQVQALGSWSAPDLVTVPRDRFVTIRIVYWTGIK